jgi:transposase-like protein
MVTATVPELDIGIHDLVDHKKCYDSLRLRRWPHAVCCLKCTSNRDKKNGHKRSDPLCQRYKCTNCRSRFDDFTGTILANKHHAISVWIVMLYLMGLNMSNRGALPVSYGCSARCDFDKFASV